MQCVKCKSDETSVVDSRMIEEGKAIRRRRKCEVCGHRFTTFERPAFASFTVIKASGKREPYSREKLEKGVRIACHKRPVSSGQIESLMSGLEEKWAANKKEISTKRIGKDVMEALKMIDEVAFLRFASVCQDFPGADEFLDEIEKLGGRKRKKKNVEKKQVKGDEKGLFEK